jgi:hypothetical protein
MATATTLAQALQRNREALPDGFAEGTFCDTYEYRLHSAARTWQRPHAQDNLM